jgi:hypothetical protein
MNYAVGSSTSAWNDTSVTNTHESQWNYPQEQQIGSSTTTTDFPLYDPFHSGAGLTIPSTTQTPLLTNGYSGRFFSDQIIFYFLINRTFWRSMYCSTR